MKIHIKNQLGHTVEFCCGESEHILAPEEEVSVEVADEDYIYLDQVR